MDSDTLIRDEIYASPEAMRLHREMIIFDCLSLSYILDPPYDERVLEGGVTATNLTVAWEGQSWDEVLENIDQARTKIDKNGNLVFAETAAEVREAKKNGKVAVILGTQGSDFIDRHLSRVRILHKLGVRYIGLTYTGATLFADGCGEIRDAGLTFLGKEFIDAVNELPMLLDLAHTGHRSRFEGATMAKHPVCTHSNAYAVNPNDRNTKDESALIIAEKGGVMGVTGLVRAVAPCDSSIEHMVEHADHWVRRIGVQHTGLGLDFTEGFQDAQRDGKVTLKPPKWRTLRPDIFGTPEAFYTQKYPARLESIRKLPNFTHELLSRGYDSVSVCEIMGRAWLRNFELAVG
ncbi:membrane dipeptidase [Steroidobacter flavus]|uniref:Membrane dipeptidase n=1 Tax=Steroidobacter flavus TaxID=1842136 RepID=A0ABV8SYT7_9GAMM